MAAAPLWRALPTRLPNPDTHLLPCALAHSKRTANRTLHAKKALPLPALSTLCANNLEGKSLEQKQAPLPHHPHFAATWRGIVEGHWKSFRRGVARERDSAVVQHSPTFGPSTWKVATKALRAEQQPHGSMWVQALRLRRIGRRHLEELQVKRGKQAGDQRRARNPISRCLVQCNSMVHTMAHTHIILTPA